MSIEARLQNAPSERVLMDRRVVTQGVACTVAYLLAGCTSLAVPQERTIPKAAQVRTRDDQTTSVEEAPKTVWESYRGYEVFVSNTLNTHRNDSLNTRYPIVSISKEAGEARLREISLNTVCDDAWAGFVMNGRYHFLNIGYNERENGNFRFNLRLLKEFVRSNEILEVDVYHSHSLYAVLKPIAERLKHRPWIRLFGRQAVQRYVMNSLHDLKYRFLPSDKDYSAHAHIDWSLNRTKWGKDDEIKVTSKVVGPFSDFEYDVPRYRQQLKSGRNLKRTKEEIEEKYDRSVTGVKTQERKKKLNENGFKLNEEDPQKVPTAKVMQLFYQILDQAA